MHIISSVPIVILAGGLGSRLKFALSDRPKALAPINGRAFLEIVLEKIKRQGGRQFIFCIGYLGQMIRDHFGDGSKFGVTINYSEEREGLLGTGGAIRKAFTHVSERALVLNGDTYLDIDYNNLISDHLEGHLNYRSKATLSLSFLDDHRRFGTVTFEPITKRVSGFLEKAGMDAAPEPGWLNAGAYVLEAQLIQTIETGKTISLEREVFPKSLGQGDFLKAHLCQNPFYDIGTPEDWRRFEEVESNQCNQ